MSSCGLRVSSAELPACSVARKDAPAWAALLQTEERPREQGIGVTLSKANKMAKLTGRQIDYWWVDGRLLGGRRARPDFDDVRGLPAYGRCQPDLVLWVGCTRAGACEEHKAPAAAPCVVSRCPRYTAAPTKHTMVGVMIQRIDKDKNPPMEFAHVHRPAWGARVSTRSARLRGRGISGANSTSTTMPGSATPDAAVRACSEGRRGGYGCSES